MCKVHGARGLVDVIGSSWNVVPFGLPQRLRASAAHPRWLHSGVSEAGCKAFGPACQALVFHSHFGHAYLHFFGAF